MKFALVNPRWTFEGSIYFGCREPHLPLEYGYARALLTRAGHDVLIVDAQLHDRSLADVVREVERFAPDRLVITTAPSYLFWRCAPPELRVPQATLRALEHIPAIKIVVGPHASTTPRAALRKLRADVAVLGECEQTIVDLACDPAEWPSVDSIAYAAGGEVRVQGVPRAVDFSSLPALHWSAEDVRAHSHHHHRFDAAPSGPGAEVEASRGCPYHCSFCAKDNFRDDYRKRRLNVLLEEIDGLVSQGVEYIYFIDEIFLPDRALLEALIDRPVRFGVQTRIDLWQPAILDLLGEAGCVSVEAGVESITVEGRNLLDKGTRLSTEELTERLTYAKRRIPFVQANLLESGTDDPRDVEAWREHLHRHGVWANEPVPMFPYPGSPGYTRRWGPADDNAWERAMASYLEGYRRFSDIQDAHPRPLSDLEEHTRDAVQ